VASLILIIGNNARFGSLFAFFIIATSLHLSVGMAFFPLFISDDARLLSLFALFVIILAFN
jgi:hypothetical protein